jgi:hypothetical protein
MIHRLRSSSWGVRNRGIARDRVFSGCKAHHVDGPLVASSCWGVVAFRWSKSDSCKGFRAYDGISGSSPSCPKNSIWSK